MGGVVAVGSGVGDPAGGVTGSGVTSGVVTGGSVGSAVGEGVGMAVPVGAGDGSRSAAAMPVTRNDPRAPGALLSVRMVDAPIRALVGIVTVFAADPTALMTTFVASVAPELPWDHRIRTVSPAEYPFKRTIVVDPASPLSGTNVRLGTT